MPQNAFFPTNSRSFGQPQNDAKTFFFSTLNPLSPVIFATATVVAFVLLRNSRFDFPCYTQREATLQIGPEVTLRPLATSCAKDYKGHSLVQTSFTELPNLHDTHLVLPDAAQHHHPLELVERAVPGLRQRSLVRFLRVVELSPLVHVLLETFSERAIGTLEGYRDDNDTIRGRGYYHDNGDNYGNGLLYDGNGNTHENDVTQTIDLTAVKKKKRKRKGTDER